MLIMKYYFKNLLTAICGRNPYRQELDKLKEECAEWITQEEDVLSYAQFGQVAVKFFEKRRDKMFGLDGVHGNAEKQIHPV